MGSELLRTLAGPVAAELERRSGSRFLAHLAPVDDEAAALVVVAARRQADPDATHHCWAFVLESGRARSSDDGEPRDTAGAPILRHLEGAGVVDVVAVVSRWYGGTNLGRGGLVRAYGDATAAALAAATVVERPAVVTRRLTHDYDLTGAVDGVLAAHDAIEVDSAYGARVTRVVQVPRAAASAFDEAVRDATAGRVEPT